MTYAFTQGNFLLLLLLLLLLLCTPPPLQAQITASRPISQPWGPNPCLEAQIPQGAQHHTLLKCGLWPSWGYFGKMRCITGGRSISVSMFHSTWRTMTHQIVIQIKAQTSSNGLNHHESRSRFVMKPTVSFWILLEACKTLTATFCSVCIYRSVTFINNEWKSGIIQKMSVLQNHIPQYIMGGL